MGAARLTSFPGSPVVAIPLWPEAGPAGARGMRLRKESNLPRFLAKNTGCKPARPASSATAARRRTLQLTRRWAGRSLISEGPA